MAALRDDWEHKPPKWVCSRPWAGTARIDRLMALCPQVGTIWGILTRDLQGHEGHWPHCFLSLVFYCTPTPTPSANARLPGSLFKQETTPTSRDRNQHGWCMESLQFNDEAGAPHHRELWPGWLSLQGRRQSRERHTLGSSGSSSPDAGPWVLFHRKGRGDDPFLGKHLSDVYWAIEQLLAEHL